MGRLNNTESDVLEIIITNSFKRIDRHKFSTGDKALGRSILLNIMRKYGFDSVKPKETPVENKPEDLKDKNWLDLSNNWFKAD